MDTLLILQCILMVLLLASSAFFSASETVIFALTPQQIGRLRKARPLRADAVEKLLAEPTRLLSTILIGNTFVNITAASIGYLVAKRFFPDHAEAVSIATMTLALLLLGEVTPKRLAMLHTERLAPLFAPVLRFLVIAMTPLRVLLERVAGLFNKNLHAPHRTLTSDELLTAAQVAHEEGVLDESERTMVDGIIGLETLQASEVMTPRVDVIGIDLRDPPEQRVKLARSVKFRYLPVFRGSLDHPVGFLDVPRYLLSQNLDFQESIVPAWHVPETVPLDDLLRQFQKEHRHIAFVADEFGGTAGVITINDVIEEIVAGVGNEYATEKLTIQKMAENRWIVDGSTSLEDINYELGTHLESEGSDRISGWISAQTGRICRTGEVIEAQGCRVTVHRTRQNRVVTVFIEKLEEPELTDDGSTPSAKGVPHVA